MAKNKKSQAEQEAAEIELAYESVSDPQPKSSKKTGKVITIVAICIAFFALALFGTAGYLYIRNAEQNGTILENVTVAGVDLGGMTQAQAITAVNSTVSYSTTPMVVKVLDSQVEIPANCITGFNTEGAVKKAYRFGNWGFKGKRQQERQIAMTQGYAVDLTPFLELNTEAINTKLGELGAIYNTTLTQSTYEVTGTAPDQKLVVKLGTPEYGLDMDKLYTQVMDAYSKNTFLVEGECSIIAPDEVDLQSIHDAHYKAPVDASFTEKFEVTEGTDGYGFDVEAAKKQLSETPYGTTVEIPFVAIAPSVTAADLSAMLYRDELSAFSTSASSSSNRQNNLKLACQAINGVILYPGDVFSYNDTLGERTAEKGYKPAGTYMAGQTVQTYGGGICQVSSSLYYCALVADLEILVRKNHGYNTGYMPMGMDATVDWGSVDFRFKNNTDYPIRIEASAEGSKTSVRIVGTDTKEYYVKMEYEVLETYGFSTVYETMKADNAQGYKDGDVIVTPYTGYLVKTYSCKYNKETNELISRDYVATSKYNKRDKVVCKIEQPETPPATDPTAPTTAQP